MNWWKYLISFATFGLSLGGIIIPLVDYTHISALLILSISVVVLLLMSFYLPYPIVIKSIKLKEQVGVK